MGKKKSKQVKETSVVTNVSTTEEEATMEQQELVMETPASEEVTFTSNLTVDDMDAVLGEETEEAKTITDVVTELNEQFAEEPTVVTSVLEDLKATKEKKDKKKGNDEVEAHTIKVNLISEIARHQFSKKKTEDVVITTMTNLLSSAIEKKPAKVAILSEMLSFVLGKESTLSPSNRTDVNDIMDRAEQDFKANATKKIASFVTKEMHKLFDALKIDAELVVNKSTEPIAEGAVKLTEEQMEALVMEGFTKFKKTVEDNKVLIGSMLMTDNYESLWSAEVTAKATELGKTLLKYADKVAGEYINALPEENLQIFTFCKEHPERVGQVILFIMDKHLDADTIESYITEMNEHFTLDDTVVEFDLDEKTMTSVTELLKADDLTEQSSNLMELKKALDKVSEQMENVVKPELTALEEIRAHDHSNNPMTYDQYMAIRNRENKARYERLLAQ